MEISWDRCNLPRVRIKNRGSEKPTGLTAQLFIERSLTIQVTRIQERGLYVFLLQLRLILKSLQ